MEENKQALGSEAEEDDGEPDLITLTDEDGKEYTLEVIAAADHKGVHYMAMVPYIIDEKVLENEKDELDLVIMKVNSDEDGEYLDVVDDDNEFAEISAVFEKMLSDEYNVQL